MLLLRIIKILCPFMAACLALCALFFEIPSAAVRRPSESHIARVVTDHDAGKVSLQVPSRRFLRRDQPGPVVTTYSMLHLADRSFFEQRQEQLDSNEVVLFEGIGPPGTGRREHSLRNEDDAVWCVSTTKLRLQTLGLLAKAVERLKKPFPESFEDLEAWDQRLKPLRNFLAKDAWGNDIQFHMNSTTLEIVSLGKDNSLGGDGENADLLLSEQEELPSSYLDEQSKILHMAKLLDLTFQGEAMVEDKPNWRSSDLSIDQVQERLVAHQVPIEVIRSSNGWLPMTAAEATLRWIQTMSGLENAGKRLFLDVMMADSFRAINASAATGRDRVIIFDRNQVVMNDLKRIIEHEPSVKSVGIIYGGAHMPDLESRLRQLGYQETGVEWTDAISVSLPENALEKAKYAWLKKSLFELMDDGDYEADRHIKSSQIASDPEQALAEFKLEQFPPRGDSQEETERHELLEATSPML